MMHSVIVGAIAVNLIICMKQIVKQRRRQAVVITVNTFSYLKRDDLKNA